MQLSVKFHPDKQLDPAKKEAATRQFFEIQKAYEGSHIDLLAYHTLLIIFSQCCPILYDGDMTPRSPVLIVLTYRAYDADRHMICLVCSFLVLRLTSNLRATGNQGLKLVRSFDGEGLSKAEVNQRGQHLMSLF